MRAIIALLVAIVILSGGLIWFAVTQMDGGVDEEFVAPDGIAGTAVDSAARIEIEVLRQQIDEMKELVFALRERVQELESRPVAPGATLPAQPDGSLVLNQGPNAILDAYAQVVLIANRRQVNGDLKVGTPGFLEGFLGRPREQLSDDCETMTNPKLSSMLRAEQVGPIKVRMLAPAVESLKRVFENVRATDPDLYDRINTAGSLCVRQIRGSRGRTSTHSFGLAVDLNIDGRLDTLGDGKTQLGLTILADFFKDEGWVWGAGFSREDSMHFEVSRQMLERWRAEGMI